MSLKANNMSGAYAKEFEKWLESTREVGNKTTDDPGHTMDSEDEADLGCESMSSEESPEMTGDVAPILTDDEENDNASDNEIHSGIKHRYEEEPPVLEPVPSVPNNQFHNKSCSVLIDNTKLCAKSVRKCKADQKSFPKIPSLMQKDIDRNDMIEPEYEKIDKVGPCSGTKGIDEYNCLKQNGNLFDKFSAISEHCDDTPPPLIPSPEAFPTDKDNEGDEESLNTKLPNNSPDFCAMEADSTSEISRSNAGTCDHIKKDKIPSMNSQGEISIECDSTCMLGVSPNVVSPGFASSVDMDETCNQSDNQIIAREPVVESCEESNSRTRVNESLPNHSSGSGLKVEGNTNRSCPWDQDCPTLEAAVCEERKCIESLQDVLLEEPPVLSMSVPESIRRKRHTIDSVENIASSAKRKYGISTSTFRSAEQCDSDSLKSQHPTLKVETDDMTSTQHSDKHCKGSKKKISDKKKKSHEKSKGRSRSYSLVDMNKFVKRASELSRLQSQMYKLVSLLFPQIKSELMGMSPESVNFENILTDLVLSLKESSMGCPGHSDLSSFEISNKGYVTESENVSSRDVSFPKGDDDDHSTNNQSQQKSSTCVASFHDKSSDFDSSEHSSVSKLAQSSYTKTHRSTDDSAFNETMIPQLLQLTLTSEKDKILKRQPSVVINDNVCGALVAFSRLSCNILQLLLPDLTIDLFNVLGDSYHDLFNLINSVILINSGQESPK